MALTLGAFGSFKMIQNFLLYSKVGLHKDSYGLVYIFASPFFKTIYLYIIG